MKLIIGERQLQKFLQVKGYYNGKIDGIIGVKSKGAVQKLIKDYGEANDLPWNSSWKDTWSLDRVLMATAQILFKELGFYSDNVDGLYGPNTEYALEKYQNALRDIEPHDDEPGQSSVKWPRYRNMESFYGPVGQNIRSFKLPYSMRLAWDTDVVVSKISLHAKCGDSAIAVMEAARDAYGGAAVMQELNLHMFGGSLNVRKMRGGSSWSTHSWAAAIDFDPIRNQFRWTDTRATLAAKEYNVWWDLWEKAGWVSLGRERNYDWMHVQACRL